MRRGLVTFAVAALLLGVTPAWAQGPADGKKAFEEGRRYAEAHDYAKAIEAFEHSATSDPSIGAYFNLAFCHEQVKRPDNALIAYHRAAAIAQKANDARLKDVNAAIKKLLDANEWVTLRTSPDVAAAPGLQVELDGKAVPKTELNAEVIRPSAPGGHTVKVTAIGHADASTPGVASHASFTVVLGPAVDATPPPPGTPRTEPPRTEPPAASDGRWGWQKWSGVGLVGAGLVSATVGVVLSVKYRSDVAALQSETDETCKNKACAGVAGEPTADALRRRAERFDSDALRDGLITYGLAGALVVGGAVLFFTAPSSTSSAARLQVVPRVGAQENGLSLMGTF